MSRPIHPDFAKYLELKDLGLIDLYTTLRNNILEIYPHSNELLYHTHALTSVYSVSKKLSDGFCMIPIYTNHLNLGFHKGTLLEDPNGLLRGTGKWIRHIPIAQKAEIFDDGVLDLVNQAIEFSLSEVLTKDVNQGLTISKIKT